jgi:hypothetical protein
MCIINLGWVWRNTWPHTFLLQACLCASRDYWVLSVHTHIFSSRCDRLVASDSKKYPCRLLWTPNLKKPAHFVSVCCCFNIRYYCYHWAYNYTLTITVLFVSIAYFMSVEYSDTWFRNLYSLVFNVLVYCNNLLFDIGKVPLESHFRQL